MSPSPAVSCARCGAPITGRFCGECGAPASGTCGGCSASLSPGARFCHRCGVEQRAGIPARLERRAWIIAALVSLVAVVVVVYEMRAGAAPPPAPDMGNAGNAGAGGTVRAPDISRMSPREQFDRLFDRVVGAAERQQPDTVALFAPMALGAYARLDAIDIDARYHAAMIHLVVGELAQAKALADTIDAESPGHLFGAVIRGEAAEAENDLSALDRAYTAFLAAWDREEAAGRREYAEHRPILEDFRTRALANQRK